MTAIDMHTPAGGGGTSNQEKFMRALISALVVAGVVGFALPAVADEGVTAPNKPKAAGRAIDDGTVTAPNKPKAAGRAIDDGTVTAPNKHQGRRPRHRRRHRDWPTSRRQYGRAVEKQAPSRRSRRSTPSRAAQLTTAVRLSPGPRISRAAPPTSKTYRYAAKLRRLSSAGNKRRQGNLPSLFALPRWRFWLVPPISLAKAGDWR